MARRISLELHLTVEELEGSYRSTKDPVERSRWHFLWLLTRGLTAKVIASITGYSAYWIGRIARRYGAGRWISTRGRPLERADSCRLDQPAARPTRQSPTRLGLPT